MIGIVALGVSVYLMRRRKRKAAVEAIEANNRQALNEGPRPWEIHELHPEGVKPELFAHQVQRPPVELG